MNIVYGGAFNPPTLAHKSIINELIKKFNPKNLIILPVGDNYKKNSLENYSHRHEMMKIALNNLNQIIISDYEQNHEYLGTYKSLEGMKQLYHLEDIHFVIGADNLADLKNWLNLEELLKNYRFIVLNRGHHNLEDIINKNFMKYADHFTIMDFNMPISSTQFRKDIEANKHLLDEGVYKYIVKNNLYKEVKE